MAGKGTAAFIAIIVVVACAVSLWHFRTSLIKWFREKPAFRTSSQLFEVVLAFLLTVFAGWFGLWKAETWNVVSANLLVGTAIESATLALYVGLKVLSAEAKERDQEKIKILEKRALDLEASIAEKSEIADRYERQHRQCLQIVLNARKVVGEKQKRLLSATEAKEQLDCIDVFNALAPDSQILLIMGCIYAYFGQSLSPEKLLDLRVYMRDSSDRDQLSIFCAWDGQRTDFAKNRSKDQHRLDGVGKMPSEVVQRWNSPDDIRIIENCETANANGTFSYLHAAQRRETCSMLTLRHVFQGNDSQATAMILSMVSSQAGLFREQDREQIRQFLAEMLGRLACEWAVLSAIRKVNVAKTG